MAMQGAPQWAVALFKELAIMNTALTGYQQEQQVNLMNVTTTLDKLQGTNKELEERMRLVGEGKAGKEDLEHVKLK
eukprot:12883441-Prorocentrum_lima.AAC.1